MEFGHYCSVSYPATALGVHRLTGKFSNAVPVPSPFVLGQPRSQSKCPTTPETSERLAQKSYDVPHDHIPNPEIDLGASQKESTLPPCRMTKQQAMCTTNL